VRFLAVALATGCAHGGELERDIDIGPKPPVKIVHRAAIADQGLSSRPLSIEFGHREDGTRLIQEIIAQAERQGARYLTDLRISISDGKERCTTEVFPQSEPRAVVETRVIPGRTETRSVPRQVTRSVTEYEYRCHSVMRPGQTTETYYEYQYDYASHSSRSVPRTRSVTRYQSQNECRSEPVTRMVTRDEFQLQSEYVPPRFETFVQHHTDMVESIPYCVQSHETENEISAVGWF
jgi:hypothetical protein